MVTDSPCASTKPVSGTAKTARSCVHRGDVAGGQVVTEHGHDLFGGRDAEALAGDLGDAELVPALREVLEELEAGKVESCSVGGERRGDVDPHGARSGVDQVLEHRARESIGVVGLQFRGALRGAGHCSAAHVREGLLQQLHEAGVRRVRGDTAHQDDAAGLHPVEE